MFYTSRSSSHGNAPPGTLRGKHKELLPRSPPGIQQDITQQGSARLWTQLAHEWTHFEGEAATNVEGAAVTSTPVVPCVDIVTAAPANAAHSTNPLSYVASATSLEEVATPAAPARMNTADLNTPTSLPFEQGDGEASPWTPFEKACVGSEKFAAALNAETAVCDVIAEKYIADGLARTQEWAMGCISICNALRDQVCASVSVCVSL